MGNSYAAIVLIGGNVHDLGLLCRETLSKKSRKMSAAI